MQLALNLFYIHGIALVIFKEIQRSTLNLFRYLIKARVKYLFMFYFFALVKPLMFIYCFRKPGSVYTFS